MKPKNLKTKIFLDSGNPEDTKQALGMIGFLDGQTTNPSLIAKNLKLKEKLSHGEALSSDEINMFYKDVVQKISSMIPHGSVSIEVYVDNKTSLEEIIVQAKKMNTWIDNAHIKLPITQAGLQAAEILTRDGLRVNMTLCFSQSQGASVYTVTNMVKKGNVFLSPFIGRLDDRGKNGMSLIKNILDMFASSDKHVEVLAASIRNYEHFQACIAMEVDIITCPLKILQEWKNHNFEIPDSSYIYETGNMSDIAYENISLEQSWNKYDIHHNLTDRGLKKFADDWNGLISSV